MLTMINLPPNHICPVIDRSLISPRLPITAAWLSFFFHSPKSYKPSIWSEPYITQVANCCSLFFFVIFFQNATNLSIICVSDNVNRFWFYFKFRHQGWLPWLISLQIIYTQCLILALYHPGCQWQQLGYFFVFFFQNTTNLSIICDNVNHY